ncbi:MAG: hypothetical protein QOI86_5296 [Actinomycetota bacterium]|jgi:predicted lipoprotein with Yx(FWY)xxD motif|nr:hypothetical protein [Actinomycetota bacterium]
MKLLLGIAVAGLGLSLTACGSSGSKTQAGNAPAPAPAQPPGGQTGATVAVAQNPTDGAILVDASGRTLYLFEKDKGTTSACSGACASVWPALTAQGAPGGGSGVDGSKLATANGQVANQVVYNGHLLYHYSGDSGPGDIKGVGIPGWYPVGPSGAKVDKDGSGSGSGGSGY